MCNNGSEGSRSTRNSELGAANAVSAAIFNFRLPVVAPSIVGVSLGLLITATSSALTTFYAIQI